MFEPGENPAYETLADNAAGLIEGWLQNEWYETSTQRVGQGSSKEFGEMRLENAWA